MNMVDSTGARGLGEPLSVSALVPQRQPVSFCNSGPA